jgi:hypothetical protein
VPPAWNDAQFTLWKQFGSLLCPALRAPYSGAKSSQEMEHLVVQLACQNKWWGYRRLVGALSNLGHEVSHQTVANILKLC